MAKIVFSLILLICINTLKGQNSFDSSSIKLYLSSSIVNIDDPEIPDKFRFHLFRRLTSVLNKIGIVENGFSNFLVNPRLESIGITTTETSMGKIYLAEFNLILTVERAYVGNIGRAIYNSETLKITGSGRSKDDAIASAINNLSTNEKRLISFFTKTQKKIFLEFSKNCENILAEAHRQNKLKNYTGALVIALSIPHGAPCFEKADIFSQKVYENFAIEACDKTVFEIQAYLARSQNTDSIASKYYDNLMARIEQANPFSPNSKDCFAKIRPLIAKMEERFNEKQLQQWQLKKTILSDPNLIKDDKSALAKKIIEKDIDIRN